jgi:hypothetical protein
MRSKSAQREQGYAGLQEFSTIQLFHTYDLFSDDKYKAFLMQSPYSYWFSISANKKLREILRV